MKEIEFGVITFKSTHYAIQGDIAFKEQNINYRTIPTPREITRSCGLAIKFDLEDIDLVKDIIEKNKLTIDGIFKMVKDDQGYKAERLN
ncbi:MAG: DUF3343 domain-containing protein [Tissierellia bacterium]|mgnify:CR=1 FL=1|nr:DUF3343 domain-containing protein [Tissierellia bacterium]